MIKRMTISAMLAVVVMGTMGARTLTIDECQRMARENYPLIEQLDLVQRTAQLDVDNLAKQWLPQVSAGAQVTAQNRVPAYPDALVGVMEQLGTDVKGISKVQYRAAVDVNQLIWDGGTVAVARDLASRQAAVSAASTEVDLYALRRRVNELYFGILLVEENQRVNADLQTLLADNLRRITTMQRHGTASGGDVAAIKAQLLGAEQQAVALRSQRDALARVLGVMVGVDSLDVVKPLPPAVTAAMRPELKLFDEQERMLDTRERQLRAALMPRVSAFAQGYYGYTGYDMFHDMMHRTPSLNAMVGVRVTWNIGNWYTRHNDRAKLDVQRATVASNRSTFELNRRMQLEQDDATIAGYREMMQQDDEIIGLRQTVRKAAESKLNHGIIDVNALLQEITRENQARIERATHEIELLKAQHQLALD